VLGEGTEDGVGAIMGRAVVIATGGMGQIFSATTNPIVSTGDGVALALRAGAAVTDLEFVQFHPTAFVPPATDGRRSAQQPLISEAVRGEVVSSTATATVHGGSNELAELAPRDIVAKGSYRAMLQAGTDTSPTPAISPMWHPLPDHHASRRAAGIDPEVD
jgi:L-aspartate oxidase